MKPSEEEIRFAKLRFKIQEAICTCFTTAELCLDLDCVAGGGNVDSVIGAMQGDALAGQILTQDRTYRGKKTGTHTKIEAAIGYTGEWIAIVTVTSSASDPIQIIYEKNKGEANHELIRVLVEEMKKIQ